MKERYEEENWLPMPDFEGWYEISDYGRVRRVRAYNSTYVGRFLSQPNDGRGYLQVCLCKNGKHYVARPHQLVMAAFVGPRQGDMQVNHKDGVKTNNRLDNLEYVTRSENAIHAYGLGLQSQRGEKNANSCLTEEGVHGIRHLLAEGMTQELISIRFNVSQSTISSISRGKLWSHVKEPDDLTNTEE